jgi:hypothetical protein
MQPSAEATLQDAGFEVAVKSVPNDAKPGIVWSRIRRLGHGPTRAPW